MSLVMGCAPDWSLIRGLSVLGFVALATMPAASFFASAAPALTLLAQPATAIRLRAPSRQ
jgi:hypothetical protein